MNEEDSPIKVEFPSKVRVTSPEIDSINKSTSRISNWLHNDLKKIIEPLTVVKFIPELLKELKNVIVNQFTNLLLGQIEVAVIKKQSNIKTLEKKITLTNDLINQKEEDFQREIKEIEKRYKAIINELNIQLERFLRNLDKNAYDIIEKIYPYDIQNKFSYDSLPSINFLSEHAMVTLVGRNVCLDKGLNSALSRLINFEEKREDLYNKLENYACHQLTSGRYELPFCYIELEDSESGETIQEYWFECELEIGKQIPALNELREEIKNRSFLTDKSETKNDIYFELEDFLNEKLILQEKERLFNDLQ